MTRLRQSYSGTRKSTEGNEGNKDFVKSITAFVVSQIFVFFVAFCKKDSTAANPERLRRNPKRLARE
jgi:hypothetical protein